MYRESISTVSIGHCLLPSTLLPQDGKGMIYVGLSKLGGRCGSHAREMLDTAK